MSIRPLSKELEEIAKSELNEVPTRLGDDINHILEWIRKQPHLKARTDPQWIVNFLRGCKFSLQKTKQKIDTYYTMRTIVPDYFSNRNPFLPELQRPYKLNACTILPRESPTAPMRALIIGRNGNPEECTIKDCMRMTLMLMDVFIYEDDAAIVNGQEVIIDFTDVPKGYIAQMTPNLLKTGVLIEQAYPTRLKAIRLINVPSYAHFAVNIFLSFLPSKIRSRVHIHTNSDQDNLFHAIPRTVLPEEYGGDAGPMSKLTEKLNRYMQEHYQWLQKDSKYCTDESKRPGKPITYNEYFNLEGSFRKLETD